MAEPQADIRDLEHTADLGIEITADSLSSLFAASGQALFGLMANLQPRIGRPAPWLAMRAARAIEHLRIYGQELRDRSRC